MSTVHVVLPDGIDDPSRPSGGNTYDRRMCDGLSRCGWRVREMPQMGSWPRADPAARRRLSAALGRLPDGSVVLIDGLVASGVPGVLLPEVGRLRLVVLVHLPLGLGGPARRPRDVLVEHRRESAVLTAVAAVVATSQWARDWLTTAYRLPDAHLSVVRPGADPALRAAGSTTGGRLVCVGAVTPVKGQDVLVDSLAGAADLGWSCSCIGSTTTDLTFSAGVGRRATDAGLGDRVRFTGPLVGEDIARAYARADLLVVPSRAETFGMVVTEALARGVPIVGSDVGGLPEALGATADGGAPGLLVPPEDPVALAGALRRWLTDAVLRERLRNRAQERRAGLGDWSAAVVALSDVLEGVAA